MTNQDQVAIAPFSATGAAEWQGPYGGVPPFATLSPVEIERDYRAALARMETVARELADDPDAPTFSNSFEPLEQAAQSLNDAEALLRAVANGALDSEMADVLARVAPLRPALEDRLSHDTALFARLDTVAGSPDLDPPAGRVAETAIARMARRGARLTADRRARLTEINQRIATLQAAFARNLQTDTDAASLLIEDEADLAGLSDQVRAALRQEAQSRGRTEAWVVPNQRGMFDTLLATAKSRRVRERMWRMWTSRGTAANPPLVAEMLALRGEKARLLGFAHFADYAAADRMAGSAETALALVERIWARALPAADRQTDALAALAFDEGLTEPLEPWDRPYFAARWQATQFAANESELRPYLELDRMVEAMFWAAGALYQLRFTPVTGLPRLDALVQTYEVRRGDRIVGVLWLDLFARPGKRGTAWMDEFRTARPDAPALLSLNHCLSPPVPGEPVLLSWDNLKVLFHEMGHALHALLTRVPYPSLGIMNVAWDMIELPSQLFEELIYAPELLTRFARHHRTGAIIPLESVARLRAAAAADAGGQVLDQTASAIVDLRLHMQRNVDGFDPLAAEREILEDIRLPRAFAPRHMVPHFAHAFSGDAYAAGYYCYQWAEAMVADAASIFAAAPQGMLDADVAHAFEKSLLSVGNLTPAAEAWMRFAGRPVSADALMARLGLAA